MLGSPTKSDLSESLLSLRRSESPLVITNKRKHNTFEDDEVFEVQAVSKAQKINQNAGRPKAGDYEVAAREVILSAANFYRALLTSQGAFPTSSEELELVKRSWKKANDDTEMNPMALTPDIVRIVRIFVSLRVSFGLLLLLTYFQLEGQGSRFSGPWRGKNKDRIAG